MSSKPSAQAKNNYGWVASKPEQSQLNNLQPLEVFERSFEEGRKIFLEQLKW